MPTHCGVANESVRSHARGHVIRMCGLGVHTESPAWLTGGGNIISTSLMGRWDGYKILTSILSYSYTPHPR